MSKNRDFKNLKSVARAYGSRLINAVNREYSEEVARLERQSQPIQLPARDEKRSSIGIDRCLIPDARIGSIVRLYDGTPKADSQPVARGRVRKFVPREGRQDLTIVRLFNTLDLQPLLANQEIETGDSESSTSSVILYAIIENPTLLRRCMRTYFAIDSFMRMRCSESIAKLLIGDLYPNPISWRHPPTELILPITIDFKLSREQNRALQIAIKKHISVIEGTVGSGKTHLAACIAHCLAVQKFQKVLVCSPCESTVDLLAQLLMTNESSFDDNLSVIQVTDDDAIDNIGKFVAGLLKHKNAKPGSLRLRLLEQLTKSCKLNHLIAWQLYKAFRDKHMSKCNLGNNSNGNKTIEPADIERLTERNVAMCCKRTRKKAHRRILEQADIVCCTIEQASRKTISCHQFDVLIIDDAQYASDADILIPLMYPNIKQFIILGQDDVKLNYKESQDSHSMVISRNLGQERYRLFSRLVNSYGPMARLTQQFRSHEKLIEFTRAHFYRSKLRTNVGANRRFARRCVGVEEFGWLPGMGNSMSAIFSISNDSQQKEQEREQQQQPRATINSTIKTIINKLVKLEKFPESAITIVSNLDHWQRQRQSIDGVQIRNVLDMVGLENEFIILACYQPTVKCHRMSHELEPDFTRSEQALHIALTRAKLGLFVVAEQTLLDTVINTRNNNNNGNNNNESSMSQSSSKSVVWIDQESSDFCIKWRKFVNYHHEMETILSADKLIVDD